jgi:hypothetical protein
MRLISWTLQSGSEQPLPIVAQCSSFLIHCHNKLEVGEPPNCEIRQGSPVPSSESNCWLGPLTLYG